MIIKDIYDKISSLQQILKERFKMKIPYIFNKSFAVKRIRRYMDEEFTEVLHTTLNPEGPGAIRIHLIPPKNSEDITVPSVAVINGADIVPVNFFWTIITAELIRQTNEYDGKELNDTEINTIINGTVGRVKKICPYISKKKISGDINTIYTTFRQIAYREEVTTEVEYLNIGEYADMMKAPHRMDVLVSAMTKDGKWHCNQKCVHCYAAGQELSGEDELSTEDWKRILDKCREAGIPQITFTGGEPAMRDDLFELIKYARWFISRLNTNGIRLTDEYCKGLKEAELDSVQITFYSKDPEIHNRLVGAQQHENTLNGIRNAIKNGLSVSINTPLCTLNRDYIETLRFLHGEGVYYVTCSGLITTGNALSADSQSLQLSKDELKAILKEAVGYCNANGMEIAFTSPGWIEQEYFDELGISTPSCGACLSNMAVTPSGNVVPCQSWLSDEPLGNMLTDEWEKIWSCHECESLRNYSAQMTGRCPLRRYC